jgi:hypothetical protein
LIAPARAGARWGSGISLVGVALDRPHPAIIGIQDRCPTGLLLIVS